LPFNIIGSDVIAGIGWMKFEDGLRRGLHSGRLLEGALLNGAGVRAAHLGRQLPVDARQQRRGRPWHALAAVARRPLVQPKLDAEAMRPLHQFQESLCKTFATSQNFPCLSTDAESTTFHFLKNCVFWHWNLHALRIFAIMAWSH
jgi:hypothetical protein